MTLSTRLLGGQGIRALGGLALKVELDELRLVGDVSVRVDLAGLCDKLDHVAARVMFRQAEDFDDSPDVAATEPLLRQVYQQRDQVVLFYLLHHLFALAGLQPDNTGAALAALVAGERVARVHDDLGEAADACVVHPRVVCDDDGAVRLLQLLVLQLD